MCWCQEMGYRQSVEEAELSIIQRLPCNGRDSIVCISTFHSDTDMLLSCRKISMFLPFRSRQGFQRLKACTTRHLCTSNGPNENEKSKESAPLTFYEKWQPHSMKIGVGAAASLTLYGLSSFMWDMTYNIMTMSPASGKKISLSSHLVVTFPLCCCCYHFQRNVLWLCIWSGYHLHGCFFGLLRPHRYQSGRQ